MVNEAAQASWAALVERPRRVLASERRRVREERGAPALQPAFVLDVFAMPVKRHDLCCGALRMRMGRGTNS